MSLSITTKLIVEAAQRRNWSIKIINEKSNLVQLTDVAGTIYFTRNNVSHKGAGVNEVIAKDKQLFSKLVKQINGVTQPDSITVHNLDEAKAFLRTHSLVVAKPINMAHGNGVTTDISNENHLLVALHKIDNLGKTPMLQQHIVGEDYRILVIGGRIVAAAIREPASVIGDGINTIEQLIHIENKKSDRGVGYTKSKSFINTTEAKSYAGITYGNVPKKNEVVTVMGVANIGMGGVAIDVTDTLSAAIIKQSQLVINSFHLELAGIDFMVDKNSVPYLIEINTHPSFGLHTYPVQGKPRMVAEDYLDWIVS